MERGNEVKRSYGINGTGNGGFDKTFTGNLGFTDGKSVKCSGSGTDENECFQ